MKKLLLVFCLLASSALFASSAASAVVEKPAGWESNSDLRNLFCLLQNGDIPAARQLVQLVPDINFPDANGRDENVLHKITTYYFNKEIAAVAILFLLQHGASPGAITRAGRSVLSIALSKRYPAWVIDVIQQHGG